MRVYEKDGGYTTFSMVVALLLTLSLLFTTAQVYRITSAAASIQDVADAAALSAENQVAEFMIAVRLCDAVVLSLTLTALMTTGLGVAALCTPVTATLSEKLISAGKQVLEARNIFADTASQGLNAYQKLLPFLAAAKASTVAHQNEGGIYQPEYKAIALLLPGSGEDIVVEHDEGAEDLQEEVDEKSDEIQDAGNRAEDAAKKANTAKLDAYDHDCGLNPEYCCYQRAQSLAGMGGRSNPYFSSVDTWSFSAALSRAQEYYWQRYEQESPDSWSTEDQARSALRETFYRYAAEELSNGYVYESGEYFDAYFPLLFKNTDQMRDTYLYTSADYPVSVDEWGNYYMHAWEGCPFFDDFLYWGSIAELEEGGFEACPECEFSAYSLGQVAQASSNISNGFEYHYRIVAEEAENYRVAKTDLNSASKEVKQESQGIFDRILEILQESANKRIEAKPPGSFGAIVLAIDVSSMSSSVGFENSFVQGSTVLGTRAAVSGATLLEDESDEAKTVMSSLLDDIRSQGGILLGALGIVLDCWSTLLNTYIWGQDAVKDAIENAVNAIPFASQSGLGTWASKQFSNAMKGLGLQAPKLKSLRAVKVNTGYVAGECEEPMSIGFLAAKQVGIATGEEGGLMGAALGYVRFAVLGKLNNTFEIATIRPFGKDGPSIPITVTLPSEVQDMAGGMLESLIGRMREVTAGEAAVGTWK